MFSFVKKNTKQISLENFEKFADILQLSQGDSGTDVSQWIYKIFENIFFTEYLRATTAS